MTLSITTRNIAKLRSALTRNAKRSFYRPGFTQIATFHSFTRSTPPSAIAEAARQDGACIISGLYKPSQVDSFNAEVDTALSDLVAGRPDVTDSFLQTFHGSQTKRLNNLCNISRTWREELVDDDFMHDICEEFIAKKWGDYWLSTAQMIEIGPGSKGQPLHPDGAQWWPFWEMDQASSNSMLLNFLVAATDTTASNGATCVIPGSHRFDYSDLDPDSTDPPPSWKDEDAIPVELKAGDCLLVGGRIVHKGGANSTADEFRRVLTVTVVNSAFTMEEASPLLVSGEMAEGMSERARKLLGFREMRPFGSVGIWQGESQQLRKGG